MSLYDVILVGFSRPPKVGGTPADALVEVFRIDREAAEVLVANLPSVVRSGVAEDVARKYFNAFLYMGAECEFRLTPLVDEQDLSLPPVRPDTDAVSISSAEALRAGAADPPASEPTSAVSDRRFESSGASEALASTPPSPVGSDSDFRVDDRFPIESESLPLVLPEGVDDWDRWLDIDSKEAARPVMTESLTSNGDHTRMEAPRNAALLAALEERASIEPTESTSSAPGAAAEERAQDERRPGTPVPDRSREEG